MNELKLLLESVLKEIETKVTDEVTVLKAKWGAEKQQLENDKQQLIAEFNIEKENLKARIEALCNYPELSITTTTNIPVVNNDDANVSITTNTDNLITTDTAVI